MFNQQVSPVFQWLVDKPVWPCVPTPDGSRLPARIARTLSGIHWLPRHGLMEPTGDGQHHQPRRSRPTTRVDTLDPSVGVMVTPPTTALYEPAPPSIAAVTGAAEESPECRRPTPPSGHDPRQITGRFASDSGNSLAHPARWRRT
jgi:hypothetical protein